LELKKDRGVRSGDTAGANKEGLLRSLSHIENRSAAKDRGQERRRGTCERKGKKQNGYCQPQTMNSAPFPAKHLLPYVQCESPVSFISISAV